MATYTPLQSITLSNTSSTVTFNNIDQTYADLVVEIVPVVNGNTTIGMQFNGDNGSTYSMTDLYGTGSTTTGARTSNDNSGVRISYQVTSRTTNYTLITANILNYSNSSFYKSVLSRAGSTTEGVDAIVGTWRNTAAITSITLYPISSSFAAGSTFNLYGISPINAKATQASGGTGIYYDNSYVYHVFAGTGTFTPNKNLTADVLVIAGGGCGGGPTGGGGGAGGLSVQSSRSLTGGTSYTVTVGAGGAATSGQGSSGANSTFDTITSNGGGAAGFGGSTSPLSGGSGGGWMNSGASATQGNTGGATGYGNAGASGANTAQYGLGGGGGAGGAGGTGTTAAPGVGGVGLSGSSVALLDAIGAATSTGQLYSSHYYYAGGGGGGWNGSSSGGAGGLGGGGTGGNAPTPGTTGTGGGGGGCNNYTGNINIGGNGGSGLVVVRYPR